MALYIHDIQPVIFSLGSIEVRWYGVAYVAGIVLAWIYGKHLIQSSHLFNIQPQQFDDFIVWATVGIILGGRVGDILFYHPQDLWRIWEYFYIWEPGRSFHGGLIGVFVASFLFCKKHHIRLLPFADILALISPIGLFLGRVSNFINGELWGRKTTVPWAVIFPAAGHEPRHPSQLYEALAEGLCLFLILYSLDNQGLRVKRPGTLAGLFLIGYGIARIVVEFFREPDGYVASLSNLVTMGQMLSIPLVLAGFAIVLGAKTSRPQDG